MSLNGQQIKRDAIEALFLEQPAQFLIPRFLTQLSKLSQMVKVFGPYKGVGIAEQRWSDYQRFDWSLRQLPAISVYKGAEEAKVSDNSWLNGTVRLMVFWPANFRRSDLARIPDAFSAALISFLGSELSFQLLDSNANTDRSVVVPGLNEFGKETNETKNVEGVVESELVPVTMIDIKFRVDLRAFYRYLEKDGRTKEQPFERTLDNLTEVFGNYLGTGTDVTDVQLVVPDNITIDP